MRVKITQGKFEGINACANERGVIAALAVDQIRARGKEPLFVGGTPLYLKSLLRGLFDGPPADWAFCTPFNFAVRTWSPPSGFNRMPPTIRIGVRGKKRG